MNAYDTEQAGSTARYTNTAALGIAPAPVNPTADQTANFNASVAAGKMTTAPKAEVSTLSTDQGQNIVNTATEAHNADMARLAANSAGTTGASDTTTPKATPGSMSYDEAKTLGVDLNTAAYDPATNTYTPSTTGVDPQVKSLQDKLKADESEINGTFAPMYAAADDATRSMISSIQSIYGARMEDMRQQNARSNAAISSFGVRQGTSRYAGEVQAGILSANERAGLGRLNELAAQESAKISEANTALTDKKFSIFLKARDELSAVRKETQSQLQKLQTTALAEQKKIKDKQIQASRDGAVAGLLEQGITDPSKILDYLNYDDQGNAKGDFTAKEVADAVKSLAPEDNLKSLTGATKNFYALKQKGMLPDSVTSLPEGQQLFAFLRQEKQATTIYKNSVNNNGGKIKPQTKDISDMQGLLNDTTPRENGYSIKGADTYTDPYVYKAAYDKWTSPQYNYSPQDFVKHFPPKAYINPEDNGILPSYLQNTTKSKKTGGA